MGYVVKARRLTDEDFERFLLWGFHNIKAECVMLDIFEEGDKAGLDSFVTTFFIAYMPEVNVVIVRDEDGFDALYHGNPEDALRAIFSERFSEHPLFLAIVDDIVEAWKKAVSP